jgi:hypothetical protein
MTTNDAPLARMDVPAVREAYIDLRICELRVLAAETALEFWREQPQPSLRLLVRSAMKRGDSQRRK